MTIIYLDLETSGLDPNKHEILEVAFAEEGGTVMSFFLPHSPSMKRNAEQKALVVNKYHGRYQLAENWQMWENIFFKALEGATIVGANPAFDTAFLQARWKTAPWHYRMLDIQSYAMGALGYSTPPSLYAIYEDLTKMGYEIHRPDHSAASDVKTLMDAHIALQEIYRLGTTSNGAQKRVGAKMVETPTPPTPDSLQGNLDSLKA